MIHLIKMPNMRHTPISDQLAELFHKPIPSDNELMVDGSDRQINEGEVGHDEGESHLSSVGEQNSQVTSLVLVADNTREVPKNIQPDQNREEHEGSRNNYSNRAPQIPAQTEDPYTDAQKQVLFQIRLDREKAEIRELASSKFLNFSIGLSLTVLSLSALTLVTRTMFGSKGK